MQAATPYRDPYAGLTLNPKPYKGLARIVDEDGLAVFKDRGFFATKEEANAAGREEARRLDREIPSNTRLARSNCRTVSIDWGHAHYPYLDASGTPVRDPYA